MRLAARQQSRASSRDHGGIVGAELGRREDRSEALLLGNARHLRAQTPVGRRGSDAPSSNPVSRSAMIVQTAPAAYA